MPVDTRSLVALSDLAAQHPTPSLPAPRRIPPRIAALAVASVAAGLVCGFVVPVEDVALASTASALVPAHRTPVVAAPAVLLSGAASPFAAAVAAVVPSLSPADVVVVPAAGLRGPSADVPPARSTSPLLRVSATGAGLAQAAAYRPTRPLPAGSGSGRRIVYAERAAHLWVVGADGLVIRDYAVTGRVGRPRPGVYHVYSKSTVATNPGERLRFEYMVRFAYGLTGARIGFHTIPRYYDGVPIQRESQLGRAIGAGGCVRQTRADAEWLYAWARVGDAVVVRL